MILLQWHSKELPLNLAWSSTWSVCGEDVQNVPRWVSNPGETAEETLALACQWREAE